MRELIDWVHIAAIICWSLTGAVWVWSSVKRRDDKALALGGLWIALVSVAVPAWWPS